MEIFILGWIFFSVLIALLAQGKNRSGAGFFFLSLIISPLISAIILLLMPKGPEGKKGSLNNLFRDREGSPYEFDPKKVAILLAIIAIIIILRVLNSNP